MPAVLLIEDVPVVRTTLRKFLERGGHAVTACAGGNEAMPILRSQSFDAVVTDLWMKEGDGLDLIQGLRLSGNAIPIIALTGGDPRSPQATSADVATKAGADRVLLKPVTKAALLDALSELTGATHAAVAREL